MAIFGDRYKEWQAPGFRSSASTKLGWINEACQEGQAWQKSQRGFQDWNIGLDIISGNHMENPTQDYRSKITNNRLKTNINVSVAGLSAIRPWGGFQATKAYESRALMLNQTVRALYLSHFWDQSIKAALQWSATTCTGWIRPVYRRNMAGRGHGDICLDAFGMPSVLPTQMPSNGDYQRAYSVTLLDEKPIWEAHGMFPDFQDVLEPTSSKYWYSANIRKAASENSSRRWGFNPFARRNRDTSEACLVPIRYTTINDLSINLTGDTVTMGQPGSPWAYDVPSFGKDWMGRKATENDARLYPFRRLMISSQNVVMYDGPSFNWHGELDLIPFCLDKWPWEPMGFSWAHDGYKLQAGIDDIDRGTINKINADMDRPLAYNMNAVEKRQADQVDLMQPRQRIAYDGDAVDKPFTTIAPDEVYRISPEAMAFREKLIADLDYLTQSRDIVELSKSRALIKGVDQIEALISANGPLVKDKSRSMEMSVCQMANQIKYLVFQYMDSARVIGYVDEASDPHVFDYDPSSLVPSHLPGENVADEHGELLGSPTPKTQRARWMAESIPFVLTPHSIHEIHQMNYRLMLLQMRQRGFKIAECDILVANDVPDVKHASGNTTQERFWSEKFEDAQQMVKLQQEVQGLGIDVAQLLGELAGKKPEGRPPTAQVAPHLEQKADGRPTIAES